MESVAIVGYGSFGALLVKLIAPFARVVVYSRRGPGLPGLPDNARVGSLEEAAGCDVVIIATELPGMAAICQQLAEHVRPETVVMDVCSVKVKPAQVLREQLGGKCRLLATHPMFGPDSVTHNGGTAQGMKLVWCELEGGLFEREERFFVEKLSLVVQRMTCDEHDRQMAWVHGLTFFVGRSLLSLEIPDLTLDTGYYRKLLDLRDLESTHSMELFETVELGNPYAQEVREKYMAVLRQLEAETMSKGHE